MKNTEYQGAWMTDIDDTLLLSGEMPDDKKLSEIAEFSEILKKHKILWIPMSGVAMVKLGPRILFRLPNDDFSNIHYYGGDGSLKYYYKDSISQWVEDESFSQLFSDAQSYMILGESDFVESMKQLDLFSIEKLKETKEFLLSKGYDLSNCILDKLKSKLVEAGHDPESAETYFRGGSVSWMMLGDVSADPYHETENIKLRSELIEFSRNWLLENNNLEDLGLNGISVPFPGARGIKFVLMGNDKERAARDLLKWTGLEAEQMFFAGNELFDGGNDNMLRNIEGVTLLSVGDKEDNGPYIVNGRLSKESKELEGVHANRYWMDWCIEKLEKNVPWVKILEEMRSSND